MKARKTFAIAAIVAAVGGSLLVPATAMAHCDTMDGPVVLAAQAALLNGDITPVLKWVKPDNEAELTAAFRQTLAVRKKGKDAKEMADRYFFETLVRLHRAGEGAPYTGLKSTPVEPIIALSDAAIAEGSVDALVSELSAALAQGVRERFERTARLAPEAGKSVELGREYVSAYVEFTHYVERLHTAVAAAGHGEEAEPEHHD